VVADSKKSLGNKDLGFGLWLLAYKEFGQQGFWGWFVVTDPKGVWATRV
jgi:hypothetical protein